MSRHNIT